MVAVERKKTLETNINARTSDLLKVFALQDSKY
jgi:hypothetical protein